MAKSIAAKEPDTKAPPAAGHNVDESTFLKHVRILVGADLKLAEVKSARQALRKLAKADGIDLKRLDAVVALSDWEPGEIREHFAKTQQYAIWLGLPVGSQLDLFDGVPEAARPQLDWDARGYTAATTGKGEFGKPPSNCPPDQVQNWMAGWTRGQAKNAEALGKPN